MKRVHIDERDALARESAKKRGLISFAGGLPDPKLFPARALGNALRSALEHDKSEALQYGWPEGSEELREHVARGLRGRGARTRPDQVIITSGAQQALGLAIAVVSRGAIGVEDESYPGALDLFREAGRPLGTLSAAAKAFYVMPSVSNPYGSRMSSSERERLLSHAARRRAYVIEDDAYDGTWFSGASSRPLIAEAPQRVFHVGTFSKTLCPGLRIGWLVPPPALMKRVLREKQAQDLQANSLSQSLLVRYLKGTQFRAHLRECRARYQRRALRLMRAVKEHLPELRFTPPGGGFSLWLEGDFRLDQKRLLASAIAAGVSFDPGYAFRFDRRKPFAMRLCYSSVADQDIDKGVLRLAKVLAKAR